MMMNPIVSKAVISSKHIYLKTCYNYNRTITYPCIFYRNTTTNKTCSFSSSSSSTSSLELLYKKSLFIINNKQYQPINPIDNNIKLKIYALYKQIEEGPLDSNAHSKPGFFDPIGRAKYDAWLSLG